MCFLSSQASNFHCFHPQIFFRLQNWNRSKFRRPISRQSDHAGIWLWSQTRIYDTCGSNVKNWDSSGNEYRSGEKIRVPRINVKVGGVHAISWEIEVWLKRGEREREREYRGVESYARHKPFFVSTPATLSILRRVIPSRDLQRPLNPLKFNERTSIPRIVDPIFR